ncbi:MAG: FAD-dependent oxidoreductase [Actinomycetota bacterium]
MDKAFAEWPHSLWASQVPSFDFEPVTPDSTFDVVIVGAGYSGLWSAHHLLEANPSLSIAVLDAQQPGFGASGRNGGWCSAFSPMSLHEVALQSSRESAIQLQTALISAVDQIGDFVQTHNIECGWRKGGTLSFATNLPQKNRLLESVQSFRDFGFDETFIQELSASDSMQKINVPRSLGATFSPHCAALHPAQLVHGIVKILLTRGVSFFGNTHVVDIQPHTITARTPQQTVSLSTNWTIRATEGFTARIPKHRRDVAPLYSYMLATEPLTQSQWKDIGWENRETVSDARNMVIYAQRTADDRIAFGGRGAPYKFASRVDSRFDRNSHIHGLIEQSMRTMFPAIGNSTITHRWGGALGVHRDWFASARVDHQTNIASLGGYVGDGVAFSYVAALEVARAISNHRIAPPLPIRNHESPKWELEPIRWIGINSLLRFTAYADRHEERTGRRHRFIGWLLEKLIP